MCFVWRGKCGASVAISSNSDDTKHVANKIVIFILGTNAKDVDRLHVTAERGASVRFHSHWDIICAQRVYHTASLLPVSLESHVIHNNKQNSEAKTFNTSFSLRGDYNGSLIDKKISKIYRELGTVVPFLLQRDWRFMANCQLHYTFFSAKTN